MTKAILECNVEPVCLVDQAVNVGVAQCEATGREGWVAVLLWQCKADSA